MSVEIIQTEFGTKVGAVEFIWARNSKEFLFANSIYIKGKPSILVDPSANFTYIERLALTQSVDMVLNTHYHGDHRSLNYLFKNKIFAAHKLDAPAISNYDYQEKISDTDPNSIYAKWRKQIFQQYHIKECPVSKLYEGNEIIDVGTTQIQLIHIPGHTPGHLALLFLDSNCLYTSDVDLTPHGPWYANKVSHIGDFIDSIHKLKNVKADYFVTSHGERIYDPDQFEKKIDRYLEYFFKRDENILEVLKESPKSFLDLAQEPIVYKKSALSDPLKAYFQWQMLQKHLDRLIELGQVTYQDGLYHLSS